MTYWHKDAATVHIHEKTREMFEAVFERPFGDIRVYMDHNGCWRGSVDFIGLSRVDLAPLATPEEAKAAAEEQYLVMESERRLEGCASNPGLDALAWNVRPWWYREGWYREDEGMWVEWDGTFPLPRWCSVIPQRALGEFDQEFLTSGEPILRGVQTVFCVCFWKPDYDRWRAWDSERRLEARP